MSRHAVSDLSSERGAIHSAAVRLWDAELRKSPIAPLSQHESPITPDTAYEVQLANVVTRRALGHAVVGKKIGVTSEAMQRLAGVMEPDYGHLFDVMQVDDDGAVQMSDLIYPRVEPELAFILRTPLTGASTTVDDVIEATDYVTAAIEIVDSRIADWKITWADTVADNGSSARFVLGDARVDPRAMDYLNTVTRLERNGEELTAAPLSEVLGNPLNAVAWLAQKLHAFDISLNAGDIILSGSPSRAIDAAAGDTFTVRIDGVGTATVHFDRDEQEGARGADD